MHMLVLLQDVAEGMTVIHAQGIIYRNLRLSTMFVHRAMDASDDASSTLVKSMAFIELSQSTTEGVIDCMMMV